MITVSICYLSIIISDQPPQRGVCFSSASAITPSIQMCSLLIYPKSNFDELIGVPSSCHPVAVRDWHINGWVIKAIVFLLLVI